MNSAKLAKGVLTVVVIIVTAVIGGIVNQYFRRAHPHVELAAIEFASYRSPDLKIDMPPELLQLLDRVPIELEGLSESGRLEDWDAQFRKAEQFKGDVARQKDALSKVISLLDARAGDSLNDETRAEFIKIWASAPGNFLEHATRFILDRDGYLERVEQSPELQKYRIHPDEWKDGSGKAKIQLSGLSNYDLGEYPIDEAKNPKDKRAIAILNLYKRIWIYQDKPFMKEVFGKLLDYLNQASDDTDKIIQIMATKREQFQPKRIKCTVVLSNMGENVLIVRGDAALVLQGLGHASQNVVVRVTGYEDDQPQTAIAIEGGKAKTIAFYSTKTIDEIKATDIPDIEPLYNSKVLDCGIYLLRVKENSGFETLSSSRKSIFGKSVVSDELAKKVGAF